MKNLKFKVHSPEHSEAIQKRLFELNRKWNSGDNEVIEWQEPDCIILDPNGNIQWWTSKTDDGYTPATLDDLYNPEFIKDEEKEREELLEEAWNKYKGNIDRLEEAFEIFKEEFNKLKKEL